MTTCLVGLAALAALAASGCVRRPQTLQPPSIRLGEDVCLECKMIINEPQFAAAYLVQNGDPRLFDDIGDMVIHLQKSGDRPVAVYVHDYEHQHWFDASGAHFVRSARIATPMGHGIVALENGQSPRSLPARRGARC